MAYETLRFDTVHWALLRRLGNLRAPLGLRGCRRVSPDTFEDLDFVRRLERFGQTCCIKDPPLITSSRRFEGRRPHEIFFGWVRLHLLLWWGVSPYRLAEVYRRQVPPLAVQGERVARADTF